MKTTGSKTPNAYSSDCPTRQILDRVGRSRVRAQLTPTNDLIRFGFVAMPAVYDVLVGPLFRLVTVDLTEPVDPTTGNVLETHEAGHALRGVPRSLAAGIVRNGTVVARDLLRRVGTPST